MSEKDLDIAAYLRSVAANPRTRKVSARRPQSMEERDRGNIVWGVTPGEDLARQVRATPDPSTTRETLAAGDRGEDVRAVQAALVQRGFDLPVDGFFGPVTWAAVKGFQEENKLVADGIVGAVTRRALKV